MIRFTSEEVKSSVEIFLYYEHSIRAKKYLEGAHYQAVLRGHLVFPDVQMPVPEEKSGKPKVQAHGHRTSRNADDHSIDIINYPSSDDDLRNIFNNYRIPSPPPKDIPDITHQESPSANIRWPLSPMKMKMAKNDKPKSSPQKINKHRKYNHMKFDYAIYGDMDPEVVEYLPHDINGDKIYRIECQPHEWIDRQKDGHWWEMHTTKRKGFLGKRKIGQCMGQYICANPHCPRVRAGSEENDSNFKIIG